MDHTPSKSESAFNGRNILSKIPQIKISRLPYSVKKGKTLFQVNYCGHTEQRVQLASLHDKNNNIKVDLVDSQLWKTLKAVGNEMMMERLLFPQVVVTLTGMDTMANYDVHLRIAAVDPYYYSYHWNKKWEVADYSDLCLNPDRQSYMHPSSPSTGEYWMKAPVCFKSVKIYGDSSSSNDSSPSNDCILLHNFHKYQLEIVVVPYNIKTLTDKYPEMSFPLTDTTFIAVDKYRNPDLEHLKLDCTPCTHDQFMAARATPILQSFPSLTVDQYYSSIPTYSQGSNSFYQHVLSISTSLKDPSISTSLKDPSIPTYPDDLPIFTYLNDPSIPLDVSDSSAKTVNKTSGQDYLGSYYSTF